MDTKPINPPPAWASAAQAAVVVLSVAVLLLPEVRGSFIRATLAVLYCVAFSNLLYTEWRAGLLNMTIREGARRDQARPLATRTLEFAAAMLGCIASVVLSLNR